MDSKVLQRLHNRAAKGGKVKGSRGAAVYNKGKVDVPQVMVHRPAAGEPAYHPDSMLLYIGGVDLADGILVFPHNDGVVVLPEHAVCMGPVHPVKDILLQRQVESGIMTAALQVIHHAAYPS